MSKASVYFTLGHPLEKHSIKAVKQGLGALPGVFSVSAGEGSGRVAVDFDTSGVRSAQIQKQLESLGYQVLDSTLDEHVM